MPTTVTFKTAAYQSTVCHEYSCNTVRASSCSCKPTSRNSTALIKNTTVSQKPVTCRRAAGRITAGVNRLA